MSNEWDDGNEEFPGEQPGESDGIKKLRAAYDRQKKANEDMRAKMAAFEARDRERTLSDVLRSKNLNPKLAQFYPANGEVSEEKIGEWLTANADVFGAPSPAPKPNVDQIPQELRDAYEQFQQPFGSPADQDLISQIKNFKVETDEDMQKFIAFMRQNPGAVQNRG